MTLNLRMLAAAMALLAHSAPRDPGIDVVTIRSREEPPVPEPTCSAQYYDRPRSKSKAQRRRERGWR